MNSKKCDRCGKYYDLYSDKEQFNSLRIFNSKSFNQYEPFKDYIDLCKDCRDKFIEWVCVNGSNS